MLTNKILGLRLSGPMQSWGNNSEYTHRNSGLFPTKSAVLGLCCAATGLKRGSEQEIEFLRTMSDSSMTAIAIPRIKNLKDKVLAIDVRRIEDFHTVDNTKTATGKVSPHSVMTYRQYLCDAEFLVLLELAEMVANELMNKLIDPCWGVWLGRKTCIPSAPVFAGIFSSIDEVCNELLEGKPLKSFTYQQEVFSFTEGSDTLMDVPLDYAIDKRVRGQRRVIINEAKT